MIDGYLHIDTLIRIIQPHLCRFSLVVNVFYNRRVDRTIEIELKKQVTLTLYVDVYLASIYIV